MSFQFASCQWEPYARAFLQKLYPSKTIDDSKIPKLIALIKEDVLRIQDPAFHQPCQIIEGTNFAESDKARVAEAIAEFKREIHA